MSYFPPQNPTSPTYQPPQSFDITRWHADHLFSRKYFVETGQYAAETKTTAAFINIRLPHQIPFNTPLHQLSSSHTTIPWKSHDDDLRRKAQSTTSSTFSPNSTNYGATSYGSHSTGTLSAGSSLTSGYGPNGTDNGNGMNQNYHPMPGSTGTGNTTLASPADNYTSISLLPYIRRLVITGFDNDGVMAGFFGPRWVGGIKPLREQERVNFLLAVRSNRSNWLKVKEHYDVGMGTNELVPFLKPVGVVEGWEREKRTAEGRWREWEELEGWEAVGERSRGKRRAPDY